MSMYLSPMQLHHIQAPLILKTPPQLLMENRSQTKLEKDI